MVNAVRQRVEVRDITPVYWLVKGQHIAYLVQRNINTTEEAEQHIMAAKADVCTTKRGSGGDMWIAVEGIPETEGFRARALPRSVCSRPSLPSAGHAEDAMQQMAKHAVGTSALHGAALCKVADVFSSVSSARS